VIFFCGVVVSFGGLDFEFCAPVIWICPSVLLRTDLGELGRAVSLSSRFGSYPPLGDLDFEFCKMLLRTV
jgi:hypothetical protein